MDTFPRLLLDHAARRPHAPALREKAYGVWQTLSWQQLATLVQELALGLAATRNAPIEDTKFGLFRM